MEQKSGPASLLRGRDRVTGKLVLSGRHLRFEPAQEIRAEVLEVVDIKRLDRRWTKLLGVIPFAPNGLDVTMRNGQSYAFTVSGRKAWIAALDDAHTETPKG